MQQSNYEAGLCYKVAMTESMKTIQESPIFYTCYWERAKDLILRENVSVPEQVSNNGLRGIEN